MNACGENTYFFPERTRVVEDNSIVRFDESAQYPLRILKGLYRPAAAFLCLPSMTSPHLTTGLEILI